MGLYRREGTCSWPLETPAEPAARYFSRTTPTNTSFLRIYLIQFPNEMSTHPTTENLKYFRDEINEVKIAMLTTYNAARGFNSRPMGTADVDAEGNIWFFTNEHSEKASEISVENSISLTYSDPKNHTYLSIIGEAEFVDDRTLMGKLWNPFVSAFFPGGLDDPALILLKITPTDAEYWDSDTSSMVVLFTMLKAGITGHRADGTIEM
jgi:general stress protein 26